MKSEYIKNMNKEVLEKANSINREIERNQEELKYWQRGISYHRNTFEIDLGLGITPVFHFIPFEEMKEMAIKYYREILEKLERELEEL